jgi:uncharacterized protein with ParB-like and HNH nuclease domain
MSKSQNAAPLIEITEERKEAAESEIREKQKIVDHYTKEYPVEVLVQKYKEGLENNTNQIYIPDYQRNKVWTDEHQSSFIESIFLGLPIPYILVAEHSKNLAEEDSVRLVIVDGTQRIRTLYRFLENELELSELKQLEHLNNFKFSDLPLARQRRFNRTTVRIVVLTEKATEKIQRDLFQRINSSSMTLNANITSIVPNDIENVSDDRLLD